ncbi:hypothetical protein PYW08_004438 [Mythimna loreyi]|uniref:Uncharacterized protein n=1 Tax=Mythimna loreyi TaxID=667449 RepID=A0ACC2QPH8_9NEOP|nr:hypothetical protein PYW08_004438 [Mythimna loreyi]
MSNNNKRGVVLHGRAREIISNVDEYFESEKMHNLKLIEQLKSASIVAGPNGDIVVTREIFARIMQTLQNASKVTERVHLATGINKNTLTRIRREKREAQASSSKGDNEIKSSMVVVTGMPFKCDIGKIVKESLNKKEKNVSIKEESESGDDEDDGMIEIEVMPR